MKFKKNSDEGFYGSHKMVRFSSSKRVLLIPRHLLERTQKTFLEYWKKNQEAVAYWYGRENDSEKTDIVLSVVIPKAFHSGGNYEVPVEESAKIGHTMSNQSLVCLAQIHTHPGKNSTHSWYDDEHAISKRNGFLSLVVPNFGNVAYNDLTNITVHECWEGKWQILDDAAKIQRIIIIDDFVDFRVEDLGNF